MNDQLRKIPNHVAIIMDGNGRWAKAKGKNRIYGHNNAKKGYLPFGYGSRSCIGANLAMSEGIIMMIKLVSQFNILPDPTFKPRIIAGISLISKNGIRVKLENI